MHITIGGNELSMHKSKELISLVVIYFFRSCLENIRDGFLYDDIFA